MNRPQRVRQVFAELQLIAGELATPADLLRLSAHVVEAAVGDEGGQPRFSLRVGGLPFELWALDVAMADGGWRVMSHESELVRSAYDDDRDLISERVETEHWLMEHAA